MRLPQGDHARVPPAGHDLMQRLVQPPPLDAPELARSLDRQYVIGLVCMLLLILAFPLYRIGEPGRRARARQAMERESVMLGHEAYNRACAACHGVDGVGGSIGPTLAAKEFLEQTSDLQMAWLIAGGMPGTTMAAWHIDLGGPLTGQEIDRMVRYLRSLERTSPSIPEWRTGARAPEDTVPDQRARDARESTERRRHRER